MDKLKRNIERELQINKYNALEKLFDVEKIEEKEAREKAEKER